MRESSCQGPISRKITCSLNKSTSIDSSFLKGTAKLNQLLSITTLYPLKMCNPLLHNNKLSNLTSLESCVKSLWSSNKKGKKDKNNSTEPNSSFNRKLNSVLTTKKTMTTSRQSGKTTMKRQMEMILTNNLRNSSIMLLTSMKLMSRKLSESTCRTSSKRTAKNSKKSSEESSGVPTTTCLKCKKCKRTTGKEWNGCRKWFNG